MKSLQSPGGTQSGSVEELIASALADLDERRRGWAEALRQDAVESVGRVGWRRQVAGVRVPVHDMYVLPLRQNTDTLSRRFVALAAEILERTTGRSEAELTLAGQGQIKPLTLEPADVDLVIARELFERVVPYRRRFEVQLVEHVETVYRERVRPWYESLLERILQAMVGSPTLPRQT